MTKQEKIQLIEIEIDTLKNGIVRAYSQQDYKNADLLQSEKIKRYAELTELDTNHDNIEPNFLNE